jgi:hypothetical protein
MELVSGVEESLGWDTSYIEAGTSEGASLLDANSLEASLAGLNCGDVSSWTASNNCDVVFLGSEAHSSILHECRLGACG